MATAVAPPISPELVLVSPDLRQRALMSLPELDPDALFRIAPRLAAPPGPSVPLALAAYLAEALVLSALRGATLIAVIGAMAFVLAR